jgi:hypothetical protein
MARSHRGAGTIIVGLPAAPLLSDAHLAATAWLPSCGAKNRRRGGQKTPLQGRLAAFHAPEAAIGF